MRFKTTTLGSRKGKNQEIKHAGGIATQCRCPKCTGGQSARAKRRAEARRNKQSPTPEGEKEK